MNLAETATSIIKGVSIETGLNLPIVNIEKRILENAHKGLSITTLSLSCELLKSIGKLKEHFKKEGYYMLESGKSEDDMMIFVFVPIEKITDML